MFVCVLDLARLLDFLRHDIQDIVFVLHRVECALFQSESWFVIAYDTNVIPHESAEFCRTFKSYRQNVLDCDVFFDWTRATFGGVEVLRGVDSCTLGCK